MLFGVFRLSSQWEKLFLGTTFWFSQNYKSGRKPQHLAEAAQVGPSRFARQSLKQTFRNLHLNFLPIKLSMSRSWGYPPGQETQQTAFRNVLALQAKMALKMTAVTATAYVRCTPTAHRAGSNSNLCHPSTGTVNAVGLLLQDTGGVFATPRKGTSFSTGLHKNKIKFTVKLSTATDNFTLLPIHLPR